MVSNIFTEETHDPIVCRHRAKISHFGQIYSSRPPSKEDILKVCDMFDHDEHCPYKTNTD